MIIAITDDIQQYQSLKKTRKEILITDQIEFDKLINNSVVINEYLFHKKDSLKIPSKIFKMLSYKKSKNYVLKTWVEDPKILNGKKVANNLLKDLKIKLNNFDLSKHKLAIVQVGDDYASSIYIKNKKKLCHELGIEVLHIHLNGNIDEKELIKQINKLNKNKKIRGILVQLPLPKHINEIEIFNAINKGKDIDCFNPYNVGEVILNKHKNIIFPCTPNGCIELLKQYNINLESKYIVIVGRSNIVGKPLSIMLLNQNATITTCHSKTKNLKEHTKKADILITAIGKANFIDKSFIKQGCICIDVGINRDKDGKLCGDINFKDVYNKIKYISPVPNGVGQMTLIMLIFNFLKLIEINNL